MKTKNKIIIGLGVILLVVLIFWGTNMNLFKGAFKGGLSPAPSGTVTVNLKITGGLATAADFPMTIGAVRVAYGTSVRLPVGRYSIAVPNVPPYVAEWGAGDCSNAATIYIYDGKDSRCTLVQRYPTVAAAPTLTYRVANPTIDPTRSGSSTSTIFYDVVGTFTSGLNIIVRDSSARNIKTLLATTSPVSTGDYSVTWDGRNGSGEIVLNGTYQYVFISGTREIATGIINVISTPTSPTGVPPTMTLNSASPFSYLPGMNVELLRFNIAASSGVQISGFPVNVIVGSSTTVVSGVRVEREAGIEITDCVDLSFCTLSASSGNIGTGSVATYSIRANIASTTGTDQIYISINTDGVQWVRNSDRAVMTGVNPRGGRVERVLSRY